jgi:hypothetical protein
LKWDGAARKSGTAASLFFFFFLNAGQEARTAGEEMKSRARARLRDCESNNAGPRWDRQSGERKKAIAPVRPDRPRNKYRLSPTWGTASR